MDPITEADSSSWVDITDDFKGLCSKLDVGELVHDVNFGLYEAMSAFEMMDPKMDSGMIGLQSLKTPPKTLASSVDSGELKLDCFDSQELCDICDGTFCALGSWIEGGSMAQTIFANLYLHNPFLIEHRVLKAFCVGMLKLVERIRDLITQTSVYEEEHFQTMTYGFQLAESVTSQRVAGMLKEAEDELCKQSRSLKSKVNEEDAVKQLDGTQQVLLRIRFLRNLYLLILNMKYEAVNTPDDSQKCLGKLKEAVLAISTSTENRRLDDPFKLVAFDIGSTSRLLPPSFPRSVQLMSHTETLELFVNFCNQLEMMLAIPKTIGLMETLCYFDKINLLNPCVLVRSLILYHYIPSGTGKVYSKLPLTDLISDELKNFNSPPAVSAAYKYTLMTINDIKLIFNAFLASAAHVIEGILSAKCNTRSRQRERLAYLLEEMGVLQTEAERADAVIDTVLKEKIGDKAVSQLSSGIGTWTLYLTTKIMMMYLSLGMELELYDIREYCYVFWYIAEVLLLWNTSSLFRAESCLAELSHHDAKVASGKKKTKQKKSASSKNMINTHQAELLLARSQQHTAGGLYKLLIALKLSKLLPTTGDYPYDNEKVRYSHRFAPFAAVNFPQVVPYESYINAISSKEPISISVIMDHLEQSCRNFQTAKNILESDQTKLTPECLSILSVAKNNMVVTRILADSLQKDVTRKVKFDFTAHRVYPLVKFAS